MQFRTEIEIIKSPADKQIIHNDTIVMLGSCFTDSIGSELDADGFQTVHNLMGPLYNPMSIANCLNRTANRAFYDPSEFILGADGYYHCLDFASRYRHHDPSALADIINHDISALADYCSAASVAIITLGSSYAYIYKPTWQTVGNCHKFPSTDFEQTFFNFAQSGHALAAITQAFPNAKLIIFTVSPVRHTAYGLHGNNLSKAHLLLAVEEALKFCDRAEYFPAFEILNDDLRDYRFYAADLKHPSEPAVHYVYEKFALKYFSPLTIETARQNRKLHKAASHRPILDNDQT